MASQIGRNDPCPCGSGKKYKKCCYQKDQGNAEPKELKTHKFKVLGSDQSDQVASGTLENQKELDAESLARAVERESQELLADYSKVDYRDKASLPPPKRHIEKEGENAFAGARHDTE